MVFEAARLAIRVGFRRTTAAVTPAMPQCGHERRADPKALRHCGLRVLTGFQRVDDAVTKVLRVGFHTAYYAANVLYRQLQTALGFWHRLCINHQTF
jgi:hypothetical protein